MLTVERKEEIRANFCKMLVCIAITHGICILVCIAECMYLLICCVLSKYPSQWCVFYD